MALLAWLSGGPAGPGLLAVTGPQPLLTGLAFGVEVTVGVAFVMSFPGTRGRFAGRRPG
jgi:hypothetical protein